MYICTNICEPVELVIIVQDTIYCWSLKCHMPDPLDRRDVMVFGHA
jgi:hypothetical protein